MNGTPRLRSAYPSTPRTGQQKSGSNDFNSRPEKSHVPLPTLKPSATEAQSPVVPISLIDAPSQRLYVLLFYAGLTAWRLGDFYGLVSDETDSLWLFMKWVAIDGAFLYGLPGLRIPWLQWSSTTISILFITHAVFDALLMFRIPVSWFHGKIWIQSR